MKDRARITAFLCTNASPTDKVPLTIFGISKNSVCFEGKLSPCIYFSNKTASLRGSLIEKWLLEIFVLGIRKRTRNLIALLLDNASLHTMTAQPEGITFVHLPPNVSSVHHTMDIGVIRQWRSLCRCKLLRNIVTETQTLQYRRSINRKNKSGFNGLVQGHTLQLFDTCEMGAKALNEIDPRTVTQCWVKSHCLRPNIESDMANLHA